MLRRYFTGVPLRHKSRQDWLDALIEACEEYSKAENRDRADHKRVAKQMAALRVERAIERITDKSAGLLQCIAFVAALVSVVPALREFTDLQSLEGGALTASGRGFYSIIFYLLAIAALPLLLNLRVSQARDPAIYRDVDKETQELLNLLGERGRRLFIAITLSIAAIAAAFWPVLIYFVTRIQHRVVAVGAWIGPLMLDLFDAGLKWVAHYLL